VRVSKVESSLASSEKGSEELPVRAYATRAWSGEHQGRMTESIRRFSRCRETDKRATFLLTTTAQPPWPGAAGLAIMEKWVLEARAPGTTGKVLRVRCSRRGSIAAYLDFLTVSCARPLRRRRATTFLPAADLLRERNPWVFARLRFFGWYVRLGIVWWSTVCPQDTNSFPTRRQEVTGR